MMLDTRVFKTVGLSWSARLPPGWEGRNPMSVRHFISPYNICTILSDCSRPGDTVWCMIYEPLAPHMKIERSRFQIDGTYLY